MQKHHQHPVQLRLELAICYDYIEAAPIVEVHLKWVSFTITM